MESERHCLLMGLDGVTHQVLLGDLSLSGAFIKMSDNAPHGLHVGEMCGLVFRDDPKLSSTKHTGMIVSLDYDKSFNISDVNCCTVHSIC